MKAALRTALLGGVLSALLPGAPAGANLIITPTFDATITTDPNAAAIEGTINQAIAAYEATFSNAVNIAIKFGEMTTGLGQSSSSVDQVSYTDFYNALVANARGANALAALNSLPNQINNPVNNQPLIVMKVANIQALGITGYATGGFAGTVTLNTSSTTPGSPGSTGTYSLLSVTEHEIDEVLGLGSDLGQAGAFFAYPQTEDLFRYSGLGVRSYALNASCPTAYFSIDGGKTNLAEFNNCSNGADSGDWSISPPTSGPLPVYVTPLVQDAFATSGAPSALGPELIALNAVGYQLAPEPASIALMSAALAGLGVVRRRRPPGPTLVH